MKIANIEKAVRIIEGKIYISAIDMYRMIPEIGSYQEWVKTLIKEIRENGKGYVLEGKEFIKENDEYLFSPEYIIISILETDDDGYQKEEGEYEYVSEYNKAIEELRKQLCKMMNWNKSKLEEIYNQ